MRITGGRTKGRLLTPLKNVRIRPSSDKVRESIFNIIGQDIPDQRVLDLFAGTGSLGIEALSRGATWALFIDNSPQCIKLIKKNLKLCGYEPSGSVLRKDLTRGLPWKHSLMKMKFDLVFLDPPYRKSYIPPILSELVDREILASQSLVIAESSKNDKLPVTFGRLQLVDTRTYGDTKITIYRYGDEK
jgi:16S rRNA (guanine966-N2)-methyltransferase